MEKEKHKRGIGEEAKNGFISCFISLLILVSIPVGVLLLCFVIVIIYGRGEVTKAVAEIQPVVRETCNLPDYVTDRSHYDSFDMNVYYEYLENEGIYISCYPANGNWHCTCSND